MKKIILPLMFSLIILIMANQSFAATATVNVTAVRIRESASTDSNILTNIYQNDNVEVLEEKGEWYKVKYGNIVGYAKSDFFTKKEENVVSNESTKSENTTVNQNSMKNQEPIENTAEMNENTDNSNVELSIGDFISLPSAVKLRIMPSFSALEKGEILPSNNVKVEAILGNWYKITDENVSGWVTKSKVITKSEVQEQPIVEQTEGTNTPTENPTEQNVTEQEQQQLQEKQPEQEKIIEEKKSRTAIVIVETARVRKSASKSAEIIDVLDEDDIVTITEEEGSFYKISTDKITSGYISKSLVKEKNASARSTMEERENEVDSEANDALNESLSQATSTVTGSDVVQFAKQFLGYPYVLRM